jgi:hypothetical protein
MTGHRIPESSATQKSHGFCYEISVDHFKLAALTANGTVISTWRIITSSKTGRSE